MRWGAVDAERAQGGRRERGAEGIDRRADSERDKAVGDDCDAEADDGNGTTHPDADTPRKTVRESPDAEEAGCRRQAVDGIVESQALDLLPGHGNEHWREDGEEAVRRHEGRGH